METAGTDLRGEPCNSGPYYLRARAPTLSGSRKETLAMKKRRFLTHATLSVVALALPAAVVLGQPALASGGRVARSYVQTNLVSDVPGLATHTDPNLVNPWGM